MADDFIDISDFINALPPMKPEELAAIEKSANDAAASINGAIRSMQSFKIHGVWDTRPICGVCQQRFTAGPEGVPTITETASGMRLTACHACAVAVISE